MTEILSLRGILDICARQNGKSISIIEECVDHLLIGNGNLVVVTHDTSNVKLLTQEIVNNIRYRKLDHILYNFNIGRIQNQFTAHVKIIEMSRLISGDCLCGMEINDILFDCPEKLFDSRLLGLAYRLSR